MSTQDNKFIVIPAGIEPKIEVIDFCSYDEIRKHLGGYVELLRTPNILFAVDEEGLLKEGLEPNFFATRAYVDMGAQTPIMGNVVIVDHQLDGPDFHGLEPADAAVMATTIAGWYLANKEQLAKFYEGAQNGK